MLLHCRLANAEEKKFSRFKGIATGVKIRQLELENEGKGHLTEGRKPNITCRCPTHAK